MSLGQCSNERRRGTLGHAEGRARTTWGVVATCAFLTLGGCSSYGDPGRCDSTATRDCTPDVGPHGSVRVGKRVLTLTRMRTASRLGDARVGRVEHARGVFVIAFVKVTTENAPSLSDEGIQLEDAHGKIYKPDGAATIAEQQAAYINDEPRPSAYNGNSAHATLQNTAVFDIPKQLLGTGLKLRFDPPGFAHLHGFIRLPTG